MKLIDHSIENLKQAIKKYKTKMLINEIIAPPDYLIYAFNVIKAKEKIKTEIKKLNIWFAWYSVYTQQHRWVWLQEVVRDWDEYFHLQIIDLYDQYVGGWRYYG